MPETPLESNLELREKTHQQECRWIRRVELTIVLRERLLFLPSLLSLPLPSSHPSSSVPSSSPLPHHLSLSLARAHTRAHTRTVMATELAHTPEVGLIGPYTGQKNGKLLLQSRKFRTPAPHAEKDRRSGWMRGERRKEGERACESERKDHESGRHQHTGRGGQSQK